MISNAIILVGLLTGFVSGMMGVGGGTVLVPGLVILVGMEQHLAQGIALAMIIPTAALGAYAYARKNNVIYGLILWMAVGALLGTILGSNVANLLPAEQLRRIFGVFVLILSAKIFLGK